MNLVRRESEPNPRHAARPFRPARSTFATLVVLGILTAVRPASAYCRTTICPLCDNDPNECPSDLPITWPSSCMAYTMQYLASKQIDLATATMVMERAFAAWQEVKCSNGSPPAVHVDHGFGTAACKLHEYNQTDANANLVIFRDDKWPYEGSGNVLGLTTVTYSRRTGVIFDVDMEINSTQHLSVDDPVPKNAYDLQSIVTHEAGHFLGMAHSLVSTATMWSTYTSGSGSFRMLDPDDAAGICAVFPPATAVQCDATPRQGFSPECGIFPSGAGGLCSLAPGTLGQSRTDGCVWLGVAGALGAMGAVRRRRRRVQVENR
ncbi:MAG TPA: matrixin family metalloprotease [Polyangiaceae bacterium]|nr:matrixin family metalloprotease [Polyangiaceae bacterium]